MAAKRIIKFVYNNFYVPLFNVFFYLKIAKKFSVDSKSLPLTSDHRKLYFIIHSLVLRRLKRFPNLINPEGFNDKIQWLKLFDQSEIQVTCSDKVLAKEFFSERVGSHHIIKTLQVAKSYKEIDFSSLPDRFVMKTNHDSGTVVVVKDKALLNHFKAKLQLVIALRTNFGYVVGEWAYTRVKRRILIEEFIDSDAGISDYKFYVVEGKVKFCHYIFDREHNAKGQIISKKGEVTGLSLHKKFDGSFHEFVVPESWQDMVKLAEELGRDFR
jgi:hypothetical protein